MDQAEIARRVKDRFGDRLLSEYEFRGQHAVTVRPADVRDVLLFLKEDPDLDFDILMDIGGVDYLGYPAERAWRYEVAYQLYSLHKNYRFRVKAGVPEDALNVPSVWDVWRVANWMEREVYDLYGVWFDGHPNLRRILCHEDFQGHALRKDYPINRRQKLVRPVEDLLTDDPDWA